MQGPDGYRGFDHLQPLYHHLRATPSASCPTSRSSSPTAPPALAGFMELMRHGARACRTPRTPGPCPGWRAASMWTMWSFAYQTDLPVLHDVDLHIQPGETIAGGGALRRREINPMPADSPVLRRYRAARSASTARMSGQADPGVPAAERRRGAAGRVFVRRQHSGEHPLRPAWTPPRRRWHEAAKLAEIYDDIVAMPDGFNTYVGERGTLALRRPEAADLHRPHLSEESAGSDSGRGHLGAGLCDGGQVAGDL